MANFQYKAINALGRAVKGRMQASNATDLEQRLTKQALDLVSYQEVENTVAYRGRVRRVDLINFCIFLEQLLNAQVPILDALRELRDSFDKGAFTDIASGLIESIEGGQSLSSAMAQYPRAFDNMFTSLIRVGEDSGQLAAVITGLAESMKWQDELRAQAKQAMMYPTFLLVLMIGVFTFLMVFLVPKLTEFLLTFQKTLPLPTQILVNISDIFVTWWPLIIGTIVAIPVSIMLAIRYNSTFRFNVDRMKIRLKPVGPVLEKIILARFANLFALMYRSGISILDTLQIIEGTMGNLVISQAIHRARELIAGGTSVSQSFAEVGVFPLLLIRMLKVGETTGNMDSALMNVSYFYNRQVRESIGGLQALMGPVMIIFIAFLYIWIVISVLGPIFDLYSKLR